MAQNGGKRPGAGRKKGGKNPATLLRDAVMATYRQRVMRLTDGLLSRQLHLSVGQTFLYRIDTIKSGKGCIHCATRAEFFLTAPCIEGKQHAESKMKSERKKPVLVTDEGEIARYLERELNGENEKDDEKMLSSQYYYMTTKEPNAGAIKDMIHQTYGSPVQSTKLVDDEGKSVPLASINITPLKHAETTGKKR